MPRNRWLALAGTASVLVLGITGFGWARGNRARGADTPVQDDHPPSAALLRRLAESADAYRTGRTVYLVVQDSGYYRVLGGFSTRDSAKAAAAVLGARWYVYATQTPPDEYGSVGGGGGGGGGASGGSNSKGDGGSGGAGGIDPTILPQVILPGCYKDTKTTLYVCPPTDSMKANVPVSAMRLQDVTRIDVTFNRRNRGPLTVSIDPEHAGAMIYTIQDFDRFIVPYYTRLFGPAEVARMRNALLTWVGRSLESAR